MLDACQTPGWLCNLPDVRKRERSIRVSAGLVPFLCRKICSRLLTWPLVVCRHALTPLGLHTRHTDFCLRCHRYPPRMQDSVSTSPLCITTPITVDYRTDAFVTNYLLVALRPAKVTFRSAWRSGHRTVGRGPGPAHIPPAGRSTCFPPAAAAAAESRLSGLRTLSPHRLPPRHSPGQRRPLGRRHRLFLPSLMPQGSSFRAAER